MGPPRCNTIELGFEWLEFGFKHGILPGQGGTLTEPTQPMDERQLQEFISKLMEIQKRFAFEQAGAQSQRRAKVKELAMQYAKKTLK